MSVVERIRRRSERPEPVVFAEGALVVEPMQRRDLKAGVLDVERSAYPTGWSLRVFQNELDQVRSGSRHYVVARLGADDAAGRTRAASGPIVGHAGLMFVLDEAHVTNVAVRPDQRRSGAASRMLLVLAEEAIRRGIEAWTLEVRASSVGAQELYRTFGFAPAGVRTGYYEPPAAAPDRPREDAIVMWCHDIRSDAYRRRLAELWEQYR